MIIQFFKADKIILTGLCGLSIILGSALRNSFDLLVKLGIAGLVLALIFLIISYQDWIAESEKL